LDFSVLSFIPYLSLCSLALTPRRKEAEAQSDERVLDFGTTFIGWWPHHAALIPAKSRCVFASLRVRVKVPVHIYGFMI
jgi:hypothetical protein